MVDFGKVFDNIKEKGQKVQKWFNDITNFLTALDYIKQSKKIAVIWHDKIDWDSLWSVLAVQKWIRNKFEDKEVVSYTNKKPLRCLIF